MSAAGSLFSPILNVVHRPVERGGLGIYVDDSSNRDEHLNRSLDDVIALLEREIRRLKESLETYRLSDHPNRSEIVRWHIRTLDERQDALERLQTMVLERQRDDGESRLH